MSNYRLFLLTFFAFLMVSSFGQPSSAQATSQPVQEQIPLGSLLRPDGTLDLKKLPAGTINPAGWQLTSQAKEPPRFAPLTDMPGNENWASGFHLPGVNGIVYAAVTDGSGNLYIGGNFTHIGDLQVNRVARWDGSTWSSLGSGINTSGASEVRAMLLVGSNLYVGGNFTQGTGAPGNRVAVWNGTSWSNLSTGIGSGNVFALASDGTNLYVGGSFTSPVARLARWNGSTWSAVSSGIGAGQVNALAYDGTANLYVGGTFTSITGVSGNVNRVARWNIPGSTWNRLGISAANNGAAGTVNTIALNGSNIFIGGSFTQVNVQTNGQTGFVAANRAAVWNGSTWSALGSGLNNTVNAFFLSGSNLYVGGTFTTAGGSSANRVAMWNGTTWSTFGTGLANNGVNALALAGSNLYVGGNFNQAGSVGAAGVAHWNGTTWANMQTGSGVFTTNINAIASDGVNVYIGLSGNPTVAGTTVNVNRIAHWDGTSWNTLGSGMNNNVNALAIASNGDLYAGGNFTTAGGTPANFVARWDGSSWSALGAGVTPNVVNALALDSNGHLYVGGSFTTAGATAVNNIARWDGTTWHDVGGGVTGGLVRAIAINASNQVFVGGTFTTAGATPVSNIAMWDGSTWSALGSGTGSEVSALAIDGSNLYAGGLFTTAGGTPANKIAMWNGTTWSRLGIGTNNGTNNDVSAIISDGFGNIYIGGNFTEAGGDPGTPGSGVPGTAGIAHWDGTSWRPFGTGLLGAPASVKSLALDQGGYLYMGGQFTTAGVLPSSNFARWTVLEEKCGLTAGTHTFYESTLPITVTVNALGTADCLEIQQFDASHPAAPAHLQNGTYWEIQALTGITGTATGYNLDLTFTTPFAPVDAFDQACRYTGVYWECDAESFTSTTVTRADVTTLSDWVVGENTDPFPNIIDSFPLTINEGEFITLTGSFDNYEGEPVSIIMDWADGTPLETFTYPPNTTTFTETHQYLDDNPSGTSSDSPFVTFIITDGFQGLSTNFNITTVFNVAPALSGVNATSANEGSSVTLTGNITDPGVLDTFTMEIDWGNGFTETVNYPAGTTSFSETYTYPDDNPSGTSSDNYTISLDLSDDDLGTDTATTSVTINNVAPTLSGVAATTINEGGTTTLSGSISDPGTQDSFSLVIDWGNGFTETVNYPAGTTSFSETYSYPDDNPTGTPSDSYTINLSLTDDDLGNDTATTSVTVNNVAPSITSANATTINEGGTATLSVNFTDPGVEDTFTAVVNWGDGGGTQTINLPAGTTSFTATHSYPDDNPTGTTSDNYTISVTLTDDDTGSDTDSTTLTVNNVAPTISGFSATTTVNEGDVVTINGNISDPGVEDTFTLVVNWGDGSTPQTFTYPAGTTSFNETHQYVDDNPTATPSDTVSVNVTLTDDDTGSDTDSASVTVNNVAPVLSNLGANSTIDENQTVTVTGNISDVGVEDTFTLEVDWADGSAVESFTYPAGTTSFAVSHTYTDDTLVARWLAQGTFTIDLTLTDDDTGSDNDSINVDVNNVAPSISSTSHTENINEGETVNLSAVFSDPSPDDTFVATIQWGDGSANTVLNLSAGATSFNSSHLYLDDNPSGTPSDIYTITVTLQDDNGGTAVEFLVPIVDNVAPEVEAGPNGSAAVNTPLSFNGIFTDVGTLDTHLIVWDMGDGTLITDTLTPTHTYTAPGQYTVTLTITDDDTGVGSDQLQINVLEVATPIYLPMVVHNLQLLPDLVVDSITVSSNDVQLVILNQGNAAVALADEFWVDLYLNPDTPPTHVNEVWQDVADEGLVWGVTDVSTLLPNGTLTLNLSHPSFMPELSDFSGTFSSGDVVYVQVDSAHINTTYGAVLESHEQESLPYNNIDSTTVSDGRAKTPRPLVKPAGTSSTTLPPR